MRKRALYIIYGVLVSFFAGFLSGNFASAVESSSETPFKVIVDGETMLSLTISGATNNTVSIDVTPTGDGGTFKESDEISVTTKSNNLTGYTLNMFTSPSALTSIDSNDSSIPELDASAEGYTASNFSTNRWGYAQKYGNNYSNFFGIGDGAEIQNLTEPTHGTTSSLKYAAKVDATLPAGSYATTVTLTITAKPVIYYMQDITYDTCPSEATKFYDQRDFNVYYVQKIGLDGLDACWMTSDLNIAEGSVLTSSLSNIEEGTTYTIPTHPTELSMIQDAQEDHSLQYFAYSSKNRNCDINVPCNSYYSFGVATAGSLSADALPAYDICPKGWKLPSSSDYQYLLDTFDTPSKLSAAPWNGSRGGIYFPFSGLSINESNQHYISSDPPGFLYAGRYGFYLTSDGGIDGDWFVSTAVGFAEDEEVSELSGVALQPAMVMGGAIRCVLSQNPTPYTMQYVAQWKDSLAVNETVSALDARDGKKYFVTKLETDSGTPDDRADCTGEGNNRVCTQIWMTQNLDYDLSAGVSSRSYADVAIEEDDIVVNPTDFVPQNSTVNNINSFLYVTNSDQSYDPGDIYYYHSDKDNNDTVYYSLSDCASAGHTEDDCKHYHAGNYYNLNAAAALNSSRYNTAVVSDYTGYMILPNSVCPRGWRLPAGSTSVDEYSDFDYLFHKNNIISNHSIGNAYNYSSPYASADDYVRLTTNPFWFTRSGALVGGSTLTNAGSKGIYWTSNVNPYGAISSMSFTSPNDSIYTNAPVLAEYGLPIRCVARTSESYVVPGPEIEPEPTTSLQSITAATCPTTLTYAYDVRDNEVYPIQKLADGNCWLLDNLRLDLTNVSLESLKGNTNASDTTLEYLKGVRTGSTSDQFATSGVKTWGTAGDESYSDPIIYVSLKNNRVFNDKRGMVGVYYNFCAASAGNYCYGNGNDDYGTPTGNATEDICPAGWKMPSSEYSSLSSAYGGYTTLVDASHLLASGWLDSATVTPKALRTGGYYWGSSYDPGHSSSAIYAALVVNIGLGSTYNTFNTGYFARNDGFSVRCVLK